MTDITRLRFTHDRAVPIIVASEAAECGLACLAMIANFHGHQFDLHSLRQRYSVSMAGITLKGLMDLGQKLGLAGRPVKVEMTGLSKLQLPAIAHWEMRHFVVITQVKSNGVVIHDPAHGRRFLRMAEFSKAFTGVALELSPAADFEPVAAKARVSLSSLWSRLTGFWAAVAQVLALTIGLQVIVFAMPFQMQLIVDQAIQQGDLDLLLVIALGFGGLVIMQAALEFMRGWSVLVFGQQMTFQIIGNVVRHLIRLPSEFFEKRHVGDILSRVSSANRIQDVLTQGFITAFMDGITSVIAVVIIFIYSSHLAWIVLTLTAIQILVVQLAFPAMRRRQERQLTESAIEQSHLMETVRAATTIKLMGRESTREGHWRNLYANVINASIASSRWTLGLISWQSLMSGLQIVVIGYFAGRLVIEGDGFTLGMLFAFMSFRQTFHDRLSSLVDQLVQLRFLGLHLERLSDIVLSEREPDDQSAMALDQARGEISLRNVSYRYGEADRLVVDGIDLIIRPGEFLAITGKTGDGKTTLFRLLLGLLRPVSGSVLLDGQVATPTLWRAWREHVGVVMQDDRLISGTLAENISFFDPDMDLDRVRQAATTAQIDAEIEAMPMKYLSLVGDMGSALSGGQKQRILLARALYRQPSILFLDEGTASLDLDTEESIASAIEAMPITRVVVAHRPALVGRADRVLVMEGGKLVERATSMRRRRPKQQGRAEPVS